LDALFTSTSATCVTGLVVVDTATRLSLFGQIVVLLLIQAGGLGIMTLSTAAMVALRRRPSFSGLAAVRDALPPGLKYYDYHRLLLDVVKFVFAIEGAGAAVLFVRFLFDLPAPSALYVAVFHSVSAFCNAGFALFSNSLESYSGDWIVCGTHAALIVLGGLGFLVIADVRFVRPWKRGRWFRLTLNSRMVLVTSGLLIVIGTVVLLFTEWNNTLAGRPYHERILAALFQSVSARTAGFNSVPIGGMANESIFFMMLLMFIGASSASCGGGIKTQTFAVLWTWGLSHLRGHRRVQVMGRSIAESSLDRAVSVVMVSAAVVVTTVMFLLVTEVGQVPHTASPGTSLELMFEAVSAFGTVGLSTGITAGLSSAGKLLLVGAMFTGRLGPLVVAMAIGRTRPVRYHYAEEQVLIG
ncbi:MAG: hypothetical protein D6806_14875, partial [Deltaproteobacteria bacterium]